MSVKKSKSTKRLTKKTQQYEQEIFGTESSTKFPSNRLKKILILTWRANASISSKEKLTKIENQTKAHH